MGSRYKVRLNGTDVYPDMASRFQPEGPHGESQIVALDPPRPGPPTSGLVLYECHVGTFTAAGTFSGVADRLGYLRDLGITALLVMPVADFPGRRNWGYDGVHLFAPSRNYGGPESLNALIDAAHDEGLAVFLDVVYNHLGPDGNYWRAYHPAFFTAAYQTPWGEAVNYDGEGSSGTRHIVLDNVRYWLEERGADGLRLDATHHINDKSLRHILREIADLAHSLGKFVIAEDERNDVRLLEEWDVDAVYADDFHHCVHALLTGEREGYYVDYDGSIEQLVDAINHRWLYEGQISPHLGKPRGTPARHLPHRRFVYCLQNHDQVGNRAFGERLHHLPGIPLSRYVAASALLLFLPCVPLLFMGQEFAAASPFQFFTDHNAELGRMVTEGRRQEFRRFSAFTDASDIPDPQDEATFLRSRLDWSEVQREPHASVLRQYRDLLHLRRGFDPSIVAARRLGPASLAVEARDGTERRLLQVNLGADPLPDPWPDWHPRWAADERQARIFHAIE